MTPVHQESPTATVDDAADPFTECDNPLFGSPGSSSADESPTPQPAPRRSDRSNRGVPPTRYAPPPYAKFAQGGGKDTSKKDEATAKAKSMILG